MPFALTATGLQTQSLLEIKTELETSYRAAFGNNVDVTEESVFGQIIGIDSEREALAQAVVLDDYTTRNPNAATGVPLDNISAITNTQRKGATQSKSSSFLATGTAATSITNGSTFQLIQTEDVWVVVDGPFLIDGGGTVVVTAQAQETGPKTFVTSPSTDWSILSPIIGWDTIEATADIDPEDTGQDVETDAALRVRRKDDLLILGNDNTAIRSEVSNLVGVTGVQVFDNKSCISSFEGIPPGAFEVVVEGGVADDIANAIFLHIPPGAESFGSEPSIDITTSEGQVVPISFTRPTDIDIDIEIDATTAGAEFSFPTNGVALIQAAILAAVEQDTVIGRDIFPEKYVSVVFVAVVTDEGGDTLSAATVSMRTGIDPFATTPIVITLRQRSDFDSANISVTVIV